MKNLKRVLILIVITSSFGCEKEGFREVYNCECEVKQCFFCFKYTETKTIYSADESSASWECDEHESELREGVNTWGSVTCTLNKIN